eukprot:7191-Heterococcus_DN1.PRE.2
MEERERRPLSSPVLSAGSGPSASGSGAYLDSEVFVVCDRIATICHVSERCFRNSEPHLQD